MSTISDDDRTLLLAGLPMLQVAELPLAGHPLVYYREAGPKNGAPILMLHGGSSDSGDFRPQFAGLGAHFRLIAWCTPGYGGSSPVTAKEPGSAEFVAVLRAFTQALGLESFHIVGSSLGTVIAMAFAEQYPEAVRSMVLLSPNTGYGRLTGSDREDWLKAWLDPGMILNADPNVLSRQLTASGTDELVLIRAGTMRESVTEYGFRQVIRMMSNVDTVSKARSIYRPVSVVVGDADVIAQLSEHGQPIADALPNCTLTVLPGLGHLLQLEAPQLLNRHISAFVLKHDAVHKGGATDA